jgi:thiol-disulfide isomerase/thioredoxin
MIDKHHVRHYVRGMARPRNASRWPLVLAVLLSLGFVASGAWAGSVVAANTGRGGQTLEIKSLPVKGKTTLIDFYSPFCPPCVRLAPVMKKLAARRSDLAIKKVNINRPGIQGIDWQSPLAQQYGIRWVPYFMIFSPTGKLVAQGKDAVDQVRRWLQEEDLTRR